MWIELHDAETGEPMLINTQLTDVLYTENGKPDEHAIIAFPNRDSIILKESYKTVRKMLTRSVDTATAERLRKREEFFKESKEWQH